MDKTLSDLIRISRTAGKNPAFVAAGGGNTSVKTIDGKYMFIKASGTALKDMNSKAGWRRLRLDKTPEISKVRRHPTEPEIAHRLLLACDDNVKSGVKPSVETLLHSLLDKYVIHVHPLVVCAYVNAKKGRIEIDRLFKRENYPPLWIPYASPGFALAKKTFRLIEAYQKHYGTKPAIMFLAKHGLFVTAKTADKVLQLLHKVIDICKSGLPKPKPVKLHRPSEKAVLQTQIAIGNAKKTITGQRLNVSFFFNNDVASFLSRKDSAKLLAKGPLGAAELVYANGPPMWIEKPDERKIISGLRTILTKKQNIPSAFVVKGLGLFIAADRKNVRTVADVIIGSLIVRSRVSHFGGVVTLSPKQQEFIKECYLTPRLRPKRH